MSSNTRRVDNRNQSLPDRQAGEYPTVSQPTKSPVQSIVDSRISFLSIGSRPITGFRKTSPYFSYSTTCSAHLNTERQHFLCLSAVFLVDIAVQSRSILMSQTVVFNSLATLHCKLAGPHEPDFPYASFTPIGVRFSQELIEVRSKTVKAYYRTFRFQSDMAPFCWALCCEVQ